MTTDERRDEIKTLLTHFKVHGISHDPKRGLSFVIRYQDLIGGATETELREIEYGLDESQRGMFLFANMNCLAPDTTTNLFVKTVGFRKLVALREAETKDLREWDQKLLDRQDAVAMQERNAVTKQQAAEALVAQALQEKQEAIQYHERVEEQQRDTIRRLQNEVACQTADIESLTKENDLLQAVKNAIRKFGNVEIK